MYVVISRQMSYNCIKIDNFMYKGCNVYYKKKVNMDIRQARKFDSDYIYYNKIQSDASTDFKMKPLGKFICRTKKI